MPSLPLPAIPSPKFLHRDNTKTLLYTVVVIHLTISIGTYPLQYKTRCPFVCILQPLTTCLHSRVLASFPTRLIADRVDTRNPTNRLPHCAHLPRQQKVSTHTSQHSATPQPWLSAISPSTEGLSSRQRTPSSQMSFAAVARSSKLRFERRSVRRTWQSDEASALERTVLVPPSALLPTARMRTLPQSPRYAANNITALLLFSLPSHIPSVPCKSLQQLLGLSLAILLCAVFPRAFQHRHLAPSAPHLTSPHLT
jgi:hypothetical protein